MSQLPLTVKLYLFLCIHLDRSLDFLVYTNQDGCRGARHVDTLILMLILLANRQFFLHLWHQIELRPHTTFQICHDYFCSALVKGNSSIITFFKCSNRRKPRP